MKKKLFIFLLLLAVSLTPGLEMTARADSDLERVLAAIGGLSNDPADYTASDAARVESVNSEYEALSAGDQAAIDSTYDHPSGDGQSYGRILESAVWAVRSFNNDSGTTLSNGTYRAVVSDSSKGKSDSSHIRNWWVESVTVVNGQATAYIYVTSGASTASKLTSFPSIWYGGQTIDRNRDNNYPLPVDLNGVTYFGGVSSTMPSVVMYSLTAQIDETVAPIELSITNNTSMFKVITASAVKNTDGSAMLTFALSGTGYRHFFKGTYEQAKANGDKTGNWISGYQNGEGKWEFQIPIAAGEMGTDVPVVAISHSYYEKYLDGQNPLDRAFYPRLINLSLEEGNAALMTGDYHATKEISVANSIPADSIPMFRPAETATLNCTGGPYSNNYGAFLVLPMLNASLDAAFVGTPADAANAVDINVFNTEDSSFTIPVKWIGSSRDPETLVNLANGKPFVLSFRSGGKWYGCNATLSEKTGTLMLEEVTVPTFGTPTFTMPEELRQIEASVFERNANMTVVDARNCQSIGAYAFKDSGLTQIRLPADCTIDDDAFAGCAALYVFAPAGGSTERFCKKDTNPCIFIESD